MGKRENLPKWAQEEIQDLERRVVDLQKERSVGPENSNTFLEGAGHIRSLDTPLGTDVRIRFEVGPREGFLCSVVDNRILQITDVGLGLRSISIEPVASNRINVRGVQ